MPLQFTKHQVLSLKTESGFSEKWLHDTIAEDPSILGLGEVEVIDQERIQEHSGRLDLLLYDGDSTRYEVEIMLGKTDPSHIIRCIEYWDVERRRYPGYEHIAVLIAEDITTRFLNVMSLMAGNIPLIAIQLSAIRVDDRLVLSFIRVLDQTSLRRDEETESGGKEVDRSYWDAKVGREIMGVADGILELVNGVRGGGYVPNYVRSHVGISRGDNLRYQILLWPKQQYVHIRIDLEDADTWLDRIEKAGLPVTKRRNDRLRVTVAPQQFSQHRGLLRELIQAALGDATRTQEL